MSRRNWAARCEAQPPAPFDISPRVTYNFGLEVKAGLDIIWSDDDGLRRVNPFDWEREFPEAMKAGGFDCVVGNPP